MSQDLKSAEEVWETTGPGTIGVSVTGVDDKPRPSRVGGRPGMRLRISAYDRLRNQETCLVKSGDPFTNGMLVRVDADQQQDPTTASVNAVKDLADLFDLRGAAFSERVEQLNEYNVRRMLDVAEDVDATNSQIQALRAMINTKWPIGGEMPMYKELSALGQTATDTQ